MRRGATLASLTQHPDRLVAGVRDAADVEAVDPSDVGGVRLGGDRFIFHDQHADGVTHRRPPSATVTAARAIGSVTSNVEPTTRMLPPRRVTVWRTSASPMPWPVAASS